jgi:hypothetical protein
MKGRFLMATDPSLLLVRLHELLEITLARCDEGLQSIDSILAASLEQKSVRQWWEEHGHEVNTAANCASDAKRAVVNAETLCERLGLDGDAGFLRNAGKELARCFSEFRAIYRKTTVPRPQTWLKEQAGLWTEFKYSLIAAQNAARAALESQLFQSLKAVEQREAAGQFGNGSETQSDVISFDDVAKLLGHTKKKRLQNAVADWRKAGHTIDDPCSYAVIRPLVLDTWKDKAGMFPPTLDEAKRILKNLG